MSMWCCNKCTDISLKLYKKYFTGYTYQMNIAFLYYSIASARNVYHVNWNISFNICFEGWIDYTTRILVSYLFGVWNYCRIWTETGSNIHNDVITLPWFGTIMWQYICTSLFAYFTAKIYIVMYILFYTLFTYFTSQKCNAVCYICLLYTSRCV